MAAEAQKKAVVLLDSTPTGTGELFFERAVELGFEPVLVSEHPERYSTLAAYRNIRVDDMSVAAIERALRNAGVHVAGVWSSLSARAELVARTAQSLGCAHADPEVVSACCDKFHVRDALERSDVRDVGFGLAHSGEEGSAIAHRLNGKVVVKPRLSSGSVGVKVCRTPDEARRHVQHLMTRSDDCRRDGVVIEEYIDGPQFGVEIFDGKTIAVRHKQISPPPASIPIGDDFPTTFSSDIHRNVAQHAERSVAAIGYTRGPAHVEIRHSQRGAHLIEINPRLVGALGPENVRYAIGVDMIDACIRFATGLPYDLIPKFSRASAVRHLVRDGTSAHAISGLDDALQVDGVVAVGTFPQWFHRKGPTSTYEDRIAYVISEADTPEQAIHAANEGLSKLRIVPETTWQYARRRIAKRLKAASLPTISG